MVKIVAYVVGAILAFVVAAAIVLPLVVDLNNYKSVITTRVKAATGRDMVIGGDIDLSVLPAPAIAVRDLRLANLDGAAAPEMARVKAAEVRIALLPLLRGEIQVERILLVDPVIELERLADGRANWEIGDASRGGPDNGAVVRLDDVVIENGTVVYRDIERGVEERIVGLRVAGGGSLSGPFRIDGQMIVRSVPLAFSAAVGALGRSAVPVGLELEMPPAGGRLTFGGSVQPDSADAALTGKLKIEGASFAEFIAALDATVPEGGPAMFDHAYSVSAAVTGSASGVKLDDLAFEVSGVQGTGTVDADFTDVPRVDVSLKLSQVDIDSMLAAEDSGPRRSAPSQQEVAPAPFVLPTGIQANLDVKVNALVFNEAVVRQVVLALALNDGVVALQQASALLPGGSDIAVFGAIDSANGKPRFSGQVEASVDNLRAVLDWFAIPAPSVPADRLRKMSFSSNLEVTPGLAKISAMDFRVDLTRVSGGVNLGLGGRPAFNAIVNIDQLNLDAYLPEVRNGPAPQNGDANPLAALAVVNGEIKARLGRLVYRSLPIEGLALDAGLRSGKLDLRSLEFDNAAGVRGVINGTIDAAGPAFDLRYGIQTENLGRFLRAADVGAAVPADGLGRFTAHGGISGNFSEVNFDAAIATPDIEVTLVGTASDPGAAPTTEVAIDLRGKNVARVGRQFGIELPLSPGAGDQPFTLKGKLAGNVARAELKAGLTVFGVDARIDGTVTGLDGALGYDVAASASHPDLAVLAALFADDDGTAGRELGDVSLKARVAGDAVQARLSGIDAAIGPNRFGGDATVRWDGPRPKLEAEVTAGDIVADMFFAAAVNDDADANADASGERWSREPIDLSALRVLDAKARVAAESLTFGALRFDDARLRLAIADGVLDVEELSGQFFGAPAEILGRLVDADVPTAEFEVLLDGADLGQLLADVADVEVVSGRVAFAGGFRSQGRSEFDLVSALAGEATVGLHEGVIHGIDLLRLGDRLGVLKSENEFLDLMAAALAGGETRIQGLDGSFKVSDGVARTDDLRAVLEGGEGRAAGSVDLPGWLIDLASEFRLTAYPDAPSFGVDLKGPIDNPAREIQDEELRGYVAAKLVDTALKEAVPEVGDETGAGAAIGEILQKLAPAPDGDGGADAASGGAVTKVDPVPEPEPQAKPEPEPEPSGGVVTKVEPALEPEPQPMKEPESESDASSGVVTKVEPQPEPEPEPEPEVEPEPSGEAVTKVEPEPSGETEAATGVVTETGTESEAGAEPEAGTRSAIGSLLDTLTGGAKARTETATEPDAAATTEPPPKPSPKPSQPFGTLLEGILQGSGN